MTQECATITAVRVTTGYRVELRFSDGVCGEVDLADRIVGRGGVMGRLQDIDLFRRVSVNEELGALVWPNGADICPDLLYAMVTGQPVQLPDAQAVAS